ncbi:MAG: aminotransferase class I/II-fold pyridoxal phosphate-dependent enzyme [Planctomycetota bacterium]|nr:MAG: aminotransferase class I/II-fold pyridoxal phosphate-dependent enzyme [Planctomycetota bacterium]
MTPASASGDLPPGRPLTPPIVASSTFSFESTADCLRAVRGEGHIYSRWGNPTVESLEARLADLCGSEAAIAFSSGMAAVSNALLSALARVGRPRLLCHREVYGGTYELVRDLLPRYGVEVRWFSSDGWEEAFEGRWGVVYAETPTNPTLRVLDLERLAVAARRVGALLVVDNTFATPLGQRPLLLGADVEVHSASKYLGGHHDLLAGVVACARDFAHTLWTHRKLFGATLDPFPAYLLHRGLETLSLRVRRQSETAWQLARWLAEQSWVERVHFPWLPEHPDHQVARRQLELPGGMLSFEVHGGLAAAAGLADRLRRIRHAASLGGTATTLTLPAATSHAGLSAEERAAAGIADGLVRLSVGLEDLDLLTTDLSAAAQGTETRPRA